MAEDCPHLYIWITACQPFVFFVAVIRRLSCLKAGDKILVYQKQNKEIVLSNASSKAIRKAQAAFSGIAEEMAVYSEDDIQKPVDEVR